MQKFYATLLTFIFLLSTTIFGQQPAVDFRYSPATYLAALCFPDDWQKSLINEKGELAYDFGPGPYAKPLTTIRIGIKEKELALTKQYFENPRIPIAVTEWAGDGLTMRQEAFALLPNPRIAATPVSSARVKRLNGLNGAVGWAAPEGVADPAFRNAAWGVNRPIQYRVQIQPGSKKRVALGICEPYKPRAGMRILELRVEGAAFQTVDPMAEGRRNLPQVFLFEAHDENTDGELAIEVHAALASPDPNVFLNAFWIFSADAAVSTEQIVSGELSAQAEVYYPCGLENESHAPTTRIDALRATIAGESVTPVIKIQSSRDFDFDKDTGLLKWNGKPYLLSSPRAISANSNNGEWLLELPAGARQVEGIVLHGNAVTSGLVGMPDLQAERQRVINFWEQEAHVPQGRIHVPDRGIQYLLEASARNMYQIREAVDGRLQFQPGPSVYRGMWLHDMVYAVEAAAFLGDLAGARAVVENVLRLQQPDGQIRVMAPHVMYRETPLLVYLVCRYAQLANDPAWLNARWQNVTRGLAWIDATRRQTLADSNASFFGLMPPSFTDGGIPGINAEYSGVYWSLIALRQAREAAVWLGHANEARQWQILFDEFMASFQRAYERDKRQDAHGHWYLPMRVADTSKTEAPQRGQWAPLEAIFRGGFLEAKNELVTGTLAVLDDSLKQGLTVNTGWLMNGVWPFFDALRGMAHLWYGNREQAVAALYAIANHASPLGTWVEEQHPQGIGNRTAGDASNASASAFYIALLRRMLVSEQGDQLSLLAGVPAAWLAPNVKIELNQAPTEFGLLSLRAQIAEDGRTASIFIARLRNAIAHNKMLLHLRAFRQQGYVMKDGKALPDYVQLDPTQDTTIELTLKNR
ncbi:hypothetical protein EDS67_04410 [candidate division KSB1 bacterium]|nr:MAG: hypothetical protein EDS67_04410 [candidate division KSB1 bacterium]MBC6949752.1 hypothetical protein [candidate division KSB1 bacterium]MCE7940652.1 hypothetical protein [Chlorobi bacterium CHB1]MDL1873877.1 hypothetical protein [Cytophagia bacterium CHB2]